jgi:hypothetical protein
MFEKITGYTDKIEMLKKTNVINVGSSKPVSLVGNIEDRMMIMIKTILTNIKGIQPVVMFFAAVRHKGQTQRRKYVTIPKSKTA